MSDDHADRLERCYTGIVFDVLRDMGHSDCVLPSDIRPLDPTRRLAGPVFTMTGGPVADLSGHETLLRWTGFLSAAPRGHVVVCQPHDRDRALMGELSAETLALRGVRGYVVDGGARDAEAILRIGFPTFCSFLTPRDVVAAWAPTAFDVSITIGNVLIRPGDFVLGDRDGVLRIPAEIVGPVIDRSETLMMTENLVRRAILEGVDPQQAYLRHGKF